MKVCLLHVLLFFCVWSAHAQSSSADSLLQRVDTFPSSIETQVLEDRIIFTPHIRPLVPIPGGRQAYFTYLWDFGDGNFSTAESPEHQYENPGDYEVSLYVVHNYDNGPRPRKPKTRVRVDSNMAVAALPPNPFRQHFFKSNGVFQLFKNADAVPGEDMSLVVGVNSVGRKGKILILTNEKLINPNGFLVASQSQYYNEILVLIEKPTELQSLWAQVNGATLTQSGSPDYGLYEELHFQGDEATDYFNELVDQYKTISLYDIDSEAGESQFSLINLDITPEMLADTNAIVTVTGIYLDEGGDAFVHKLDVPVTTSHDPNKMSVRPALLDYRLQVKKKDLTYKVQFQNDGEGDAKSIRLEMFFPDEVDVNSFELMNLYPACDTCATELDLGCYTWEIPEENKLVFHFRGIALPGTASPTVTDTDSTKGFIRFKMKTHKKLQNKPLPSYTDIYFDKNEPIRTNRSTLRFRPGLSPVLMLGLNGPMTKQNTPNGTPVNHLTGGYTFGIGLSPIAPYKRPYWQIELYASTFRTEFRHLGIPADGEIEIPHGDTNRLVYRAYHAVDSVRTNKYISLQIPVQIRYNFNRYISLGIGALAKTNWHLSGNQETTYHLANALNVAETYMREEKLPKDESRKISFAPLIDLNVGRVYLGPALGIRYYYDKIHKNNVNVY